MKNKRVPVTPNPITFELYPFLTQEKSRTHKAWYNWTPYDKNGPQTFEYQLFDGQNDHEKVS